MQAELAGATAGLVATAPMTAAMELMHRMLPAHERYPLPPRQIVDNSVDRMESEGGLPRIDEAAEEDLRLGGALAAHFGFGAMAGAAYGPIARTRPSPPIAVGIGYGLLVWTSQYLGVLPAAGLLSNAVHHPARRNGLMIAAHIVWGAALGALAHRLLDQRD
jgi:uncharacterized membrane protein YagU involved in acid resistance